MHVDSHVETNKCLTPITTLSYMMENLAIDLALVNLFLRLYLRMHYTAMMWVNKASSKARPIFHLSGNIISPSVSSQRYP